MTNAVVKYYRLDPADLRVTQEDGTVHPDPLEEVTETEKPDFPVVIVDVYLVYYEDIEIYYRVV